MPVQTAAVDHNGAVVETLRDRMKYFIEKSGKSYEEIGIEMGYAPGKARSGVNNLVRSENPSVRYLHLFCRAIHISLAELLDFEAKQ